MITKENGGLRLSFPFYSTEVHVWFTSTFQKIIYLQVYGLLYNCKPLSTQTHSFDIVGEGVWGSSPRHFWLKWCKIV